MTHTLKLTQGSTRLLFSILNIPETFTTISEVIRAAKIVEVTDVKFPAEGTALEQAEWLLKPFDLELTEAARDLCKAAATKHASKLPLSKPCMELLTALGLE
jgi:hypothetical protein